VSDCAGFVAGFALVLDDAGPVPTSAAPTVKTKTARKLRKIGEDMMR
jgi:hypothetical protein